MYRATLTIQSVLLAQQLRFTLLRKPVQQLQQLALVQLAAQLGADQVARIARTGLDRHRFEQRRQIGLVLFATRRLHLWHAMASCRRDRR